MTGTPTRSTWPHTTSPARTNVVALPKVTVTGVAVGVSSIRFHVDRVGVPVMVRTSFYPRWHAEGASGPYRVSPNLMVVIPTSNAVVLSYGSSSATNVGVVITLAAIALAVVVVLAGQVRRRRSQDE